MQNTEKITQSPVQTKNEQILSVEEIHNFLQRKPKYQLVTSILCDAILFARLSCKVHGILNIFDPQSGEHEFMLEFEYSGINSATKVLKIKDDKLDTILGQIWWDMVYVENENQKADECAELMCYRWIKAIKKYNSSYQLSA
jgi:hypothetical protein